MGDIRFTRLYERIRDAEDSVAELERLPDEEVVQALAAASREQDPYFANVLASDLLNRVRRKDTVLSTAAEGMCALDEDGQLTFMNSAAERMLGWSFDELAGRRIHDAIHYDAADGETLPWDSCPFREVIETGEPTEADDEVFTRRDGTTFVAACTASPIVRENEIQGVVIVFRDVSRLREAQDALRASEARYRLLAENASDIVTTTTPDGRFTFASPASRRVLGYAPEEIVGRHWRDLAHPEDRALIEREAGRSHGPGDEWTHTFRARRKDGTHVWIETTARAARDPESGALREVVAVSRDVTERRRAEEANARLAALVSASGDAIVGTDVDGRITIWNPAAEVLYGYSSDEAIGEHVSIIMARAEDATEPFLERVRRGEAVRDVEAVGRRKDGSVVHVSITVSPVRDASGGVVGAASVHRDVTARKRMEERLRESERHLADAQRLAHVGSWEWDVAADSVTWSEEVCRIFRRRPPRRVTRFEDMLRSFHPDDRDALRQEFERGLREAASFPYEHRIVTPAGRTRVVRGDAAIVRDDAGRPVRVLGTAEDVTALRAWEERVRRSEERLRAVVTNAPVILWGVDAEGRMTLVEGGTAILEVPPEELIGRSAFELLEHSPTAQAGLRSTLEGREADWLVEFGGRVLHTYASPMRDARGNVTGGALGVSTDVTERVEAERESRRQAARLQVLADASLAYEETRLDSRRLFDAIARSVTPRVADGCSIRIVSEDGTMVEPAAVHHRDPRVLDVLRESLVDPHPVHEGLAGRVITSGEPIFIPRVDKARLKTFARPQYAHLIDRVPLGSLIAIPLRAGDRILGTLEASRDDPANPFTDEDFVLLKEIAERAALAIENARLLEAARRVQDRTQGENRGSAG